MDSTNISSIAALFQNFNFERVFAVIIGFALIIVLARAIKNLSHRLQGNYPAHRVLFLQIATVINFVLYIGGSFLLIYAVLNPPKEVLLAVGGSAAVAIGLSLKDIVASIVAGIVLLFDRPFQVGDRVAFAGSYGEITGIGLRAVKLVTLDDSLVTIPNSRFLTDVVSSSNSGALDMMVVCSFHLALDQDLDQAKELVHEVVATSRFAYRKRPITVTLAEVATAERLAIKLSVKAYVIDCRFEKAFETDIVARVTSLFNSHNIKRPTRI